MIQVENIPKIQSDFNAIKKEPVKPKEIIKGRDKIIKFYDSISLRNNDDTLMAFFNAGLGLKSQINENAFDRFMYMFDRLEDFDLFINFL